MEMGICHAAHLVFFVCAWQFAQTYATLQKPKNRPGQLREMGDINLFSHTLSPFLEQNRKVISQPVRSNASFKTWLQAPLVVFEDAASLPLSQVSPIKGGGIRVCRGP